MQFKDLISVAALFLIKKKRDVKNRVVAIEVDCHKCSLDLEITFHIQGHKISYHLFYNNRTTEKLHMNWWKWLTRVDSIVLSEFITSNICYNITM